MRFAILPFLLLAACDGKPSKAAAKAKELPILRAVPLPPDTKVVLDGTTADPVWKNARELVVDVGGTKVHLKAAYDAERFYLVALWRDPGITMDRYWKYLGRVKWEKHTGEDGFAICWSPGSRNESFKAQGCALFCHDDRHVYPGTGGGGVDYWYFGAQTTRFFPQARDLWLRQGTEHRLRGDSGDDNILNHSDKYEGPMYAPKYIRKGSERVLTGDNAQDLTPGWIQRYWDDSKNIGREIALDVLRPRTGSRGDVIAGARYHGDKGWVLELGRALDTGNGDDLPLGDPLVPVYFGIALYNGGPRAKHATSGPIELRFVTR